MFVTNFETHFKHIDSIAVMQHSGLVYESYCIAEIELYNKNFRLIK